MMVRWVIKGERNSFTAKDSFQYPRQFLWAQH